MLAIFTIWAGCSTTEPTSEEPEPEESEKEETAEVPSWFSTSSVFQADEENETYRGYSTALSSDSSYAAQKAEEQAKSKLEEGISERLESMRAEAEDELGSESPITSTQFIQLLRKSETRISDAASISEVEVRHNEEGEGYRGFAEAEIERSDLIEELDSGLANYQTAWEEVKDSESFAGF